MMIFQQILQIFQCFKAAHFVKENGSGVLPEAGLCK